ncbi:MAG TPA: dipeptide epimerase [Gemmatimonadales bacterium]|jgi:L-alanine-DL-glutamate epimerase-like enolase superfamily enzyme
MALKLSHEILELETAHPFGIARGTQSTYRAVVVRVVDGDGAEGWGEANPSSYYGETADTVVVALQRLAPIIAEMDPFDLEGIDARMYQNIKHNAAAKAAISAALHDLVGKRLGVPVWKLWGLDPSKAPVSSFTIGIDSAATIRKKVQEASAWPILKIKVGTKDDRAILQAVRDVTDKPVRVDANCGWTATQAIAALPMLQEFGVELIEQPLPPDDLEGLARVRRASSMPIVADESCRTAADIPRLVDAVDGINIKLAKCGSLREALKMIAVARAHHMIVMVGCMIETSIGITAAAHFTPLLDVVDLDGAALLKSDPYTGATIDAGKITLPTKPGLGVEKRR